MGPADPLLVEPGDLGFGLLGRPVEGGAQIRRGGVGLHERALEMDDHLALLTVGDPWILDLRELDLDPADVRSESLQPGQLAAAHRDHVRVEFDIATSHEDVHRHLRVCGSFAGTCRGCSVLFRSTVASGFLTGRSNCSGVANQPTSDSATASTVGAYEPERMASRSSARRAVRPD